MISKKLVENELQKEEDRLNKQIELIKLKEKQDEERDERRVQRILKKEDKEEPQIKFIGKIERFDKITQRYRNDPIASAQWVNILNSNDDETNSDDNSSEEIEYRKFKIILQFM